MKTKYCTRCNKTKPLSKYYKRKTGKPTAYCKNCQKAQALERQRNVKIQCVNYKGGKCEKCNYSDYIEALDFHHKDPKKKEFSIARARLKTFGDTHRKELDKCALLCVRCHRETHADIQKKSPTESSIKSPEELKQRRIEKLKKRNEKKNKKCKDCASYIYHKSVRCIKCYNKNGRKAKIVWPSTSKLLNMIEETNRSAVAKKLGVTNNAVKKRIKNHPI